VGSLNSAVKKALRLALSKGFQLSPDALEYLEGLPDPVTIILQALERTPDGVVVIDKPLLQGLISAGGRKKHELLDARDVEPELKVLSQVSLQHYTPTPEGFLKLFRDRYERLYKLFKTRRDLGSIVHIGELRPNMHDIALVGLVTEKRRLASGAYLLELEDPTGIVTVVIPPEPKVVSKLDYVLPDVCIAVIGDYKKGKILAKDISLPEIRPPSMPEDPPAVSVLLLSDLHIGSSLFMNECFMKLVRWLRGEDLHMRELARSVKYVVIAGDIVDGAGIYPGQEEELCIKDVEKQYEEAARILSQLPDYVELVVIPGNHDATSPALPYAGFLEDYAYPLKDLSNVTTAGDPVLLSLHGVKLLASHGRSLDDVIASIPGASFTPDGVARAMQCLLRCRHLAPIYGLKTPLAPLGRDFMVIEQVPHILHMGHVHISSVSRYRGVILANSGTWQSQTKYQLSMGIHPTPCQAVLVRLDTLQATILNFV